MYSDIDSGSDSGNDYTLSEYGINHNIKLLKVYIKFIESNPDYTNMYHQEWIQLKFLLGDFENYDYEEYHPEGEDMWMSNFRHILKLIKKAKKSKLRTRKCPHCRVVSLPHKLFFDVDIKDDCVVCFSKLTIKNIVVFKCGHPLCFDCATKLRK